MKFKVKENITEEELQRGLKSVTVDDVMSHLMGVLTGGVFLEGIHI